MDWGAMGDSESSLTPLKTREGSIEQNLGLAEAIVLDLCHLSFTLILG